MRSNYKRLDGLYELVLDPAVLGVGVVAHDRCIRIVRNFARRISRGCLESLGQLAGVLASAVDQDWWAAVNR
jgi:hypothetical protein